MADPNLNKLSQAKAKEVAGELENVFRSLSENIKDIMEDALNAAEGVVKSYGKDIGKSIKSFTRDADKLLENQAKLERGQLTQKDIQKQINDLKNKEASLTLRIENLRREDAAAAAELEKELEAAVGFSRKLVTEAEKYGKAADIINKRVGVFGKALQGISRIPLVGQFVNAEEALEAMRVEAGKATLGIKILGTGFKALFKDSIADPVARITLSLGVLKKLYDLAYEGNRRVADLGKQLGTSMDNAGKLYDYYNKSATGTIANFTQVAELSQTINDRLGTNTVLNGEILAKTVEYQKALGLSSEEAANLYENGVKLTKVIEAQTNQTNKQNKIKLSLQRVSKDILSAEGLLRIQLQNNSKEFTQQALAAAKVGSNIKEARDMAMGFLDFESSIQAQMEAELLTGRELNLDRARALALQGKFGEAIESALGTQMTSQKFAELNVIQQEGYAKALNMSVDQLSEILYKRERLTKNGYEAVELLRKQGKIEEANLLEKNLAETQSLEKATEVTKQQLAQEIAAQKMKDAMISMASKLQPIVQIVNDSIIKLADFFSKYSFVGKVLGTVLAAGAIGTLIGSVVGMFKKYTEVFTGKKPQHVIVDNMPGGGMGGDGDSGIPSNAGRSGGKGGLGRIGTAFKKGGAKGGFKSIGRMLKASAKGLGGKVGLLGALGSLGMNIAEGGLNMESVGRAGISGVGSFLGGALGSLVAPGVGTIGGGIGGGMAGDWLANKIFGERKEEPEELATGGIVTSTGLAKVDKGEVYLGANSITVLKDMLNALTEQNRHLMTLIAKETAITIDGQKIANVVARNVPTTAGNLLNPASRTYG